MSEDELSRLATASGFQAIVGARGVGKQNPFHPRRVDQLASLVSGRDGVRHPHAAPLFRQRG